MKKVYILLLSIILFSGCATKDEIVYFENVQSVEGQQNLLNYEPIIQTNDVLRINVSSSSINEEIVKPFQMPGQNQQGGSSGGGQASSLMGYLVDPEGFIQFPVIGQIEVTGLRISEVRNKLEKEIEVYVKDPIIDVRIMNFSITVLGEVNSPGRIQIPDGRVSMPELMAMVGDISYDGKRENITIIREENGIKSVGTIDMTETDLFNSPYFYLKQNDIVYVEPSYRAVKSAGFFTSYQGIISLGTTIISLYLLINSL